MNSNLAKLKKMLSESDTPQENQDNFLDLFSGASNEDLMDIVNLFERHPEQIKTLNKFYKFKIKAFKNKDKKAWEEILDQEYQALEELE